MDESVPSVNSQPLITNTASRYYTHTRTHTLTMWFCHHSHEFVLCRYKLTQIVVDTTAGPHKNRTVVFLGSEDGRVLKVLTSTQGNGSHGSKLLEDIDVFNPTQWVSDTRALCFCLCIKHDFVSQCSEINPNIVLQVQRWAQGVGSGAGQGASRSVCGVFQLHHQSSSQPLRSTCHLQEVRPVHVLNYLCLLHVEYVTNEDSIKIH